MLRFSANISTLFTDMPFAARPDAAARAGFLAIEAQFPHAEMSAGAFGQAARDAGVEVVLINLPAGEFGQGERGLACLPGRREEFLAGVLRGGDYAAEIGCPRVNCLVGNVPDGSAPEACWETMVESLRLAAAALAARGVTLLIEPLNRRDNPRFILGGYAEADALLTEVGAPNMALQYDFYHAAAAGEDVLSGLERRIERIGHVQFSDFPGRGAPGSGWLDFPRLFRAVAHLPYEGWVGAEYFDPAPAGFAWRRDYGAD
ncbi:hydroxypyruvate isomerase family protein [Acidocella sp.]|uniref:hydroxypyruvate isomerase family protein n=1 Tax=Acidocella sp. TaxID=50710 RepID=UPI0026078F84|nr:TIM barrel protein [Acidocella sp.]